jgi:hypothetical protein
VRQAPPARRVAQELGRRGLAAPARLLIDAHRPLGPLLADAGAALGPFLALADGGTARLMRELIDDDAALEHLLAELDDVEEPHAKPG